MIKTLEFGRRITYFRYRLPPKRLIIFASVFVFLIVIALFLKNLSFSNKNLNDTRIVLPLAKASKNINREFSFPLKDAKGTEVSSIKYSILSAELQDQIISKGKKYSTIKGRTILILNLKVTNLYDKAIEINTRDYMRLSMNNTSELLAADIHNDPVAIQAISTKYTRLGFPISDTDKNLKIQVGEINGYKEAIDLNF